MAVAKTIVVSWAQTAEQATFVAARQAAISLACLCPSTSEQKLTQARADTSEANFTKCQQQARSKFKQMGAVSVPCALACEHCFAVDSAAHGLSTREGHSSPLTT